MNALTLDIQTFILLSLPLSLCGVSAHEQALDMVDEELWKTNNMFLKVKHACTCSSVCAPPTMTTSSYLNFSPLPPLASLLHSSISSGRRQIQRQIYFSFRDCNAHASGITARWKERRDSTLLFQRGKTMECCVFQIALIIPPRRDLLWSQVL